jgi:hypothetical protein
MPLRRLGRGLETLSALIGYTTLLYTEQSMASSGQHIFVTEVRIARQEMETGGEVFDLRLAAEALGEVAFPIFILFTAKPRLRNDEVVAALIFPMQDGSTGALECSTKAHVGLIKIEFIPQAYGKVWLALHYQGEIFYEVAFSVGPFP